MTRRQHRRLAVLMDTNEGAMHRLRTKGGRGVLVALMLISLVPLVVTPTAQQALHRATRSYSDWLRAQLRVPVDASLEASLEAALAAAEAAHARTPHAYVEAFVAAYEAQHHEGTLAGAFSALDLSNEALIAFLQGRIARLAGQALLPRVLLLSACAPPTSSVERLGPGLGTIASATTALRAVARHVLEVGSLGGGLRMLTSAQPRGP